MPLSTPSSPASSSGCCQILTMLALSDAVGARRADFDHDGPDIPSVEERHEVERVRIGRQGLVAPIERPTPVDHLVHLARGLGQHFLEHEVVIDDRHAPDRGFDRAALDGALGQLVRRWRLRKGRLRGCSSERDGRDEQHPSSFSPHLPGGNTVFQSLFMSTTVHPCGLTPHPAPCRACRFSIACRRRIRAPHRCGGQCRRRTRQHMPVRHRRTGAIAIHPLFDPALLDLLIDHSVQVAADFFDIQPLRQRLFCFMLSRVLSMMFAGSKLGGNERGGNSLNVATNSKTSSFIP